MEEGTLTARIAELYGEVDWESAVGNLHVAAIAGAPSCAIAIGPSAPKSALDRFVLGFARARADVIVTSGAILRAEPALIHRYAESADEEAMLARWRKRVLHRAAPPALVVVSSSAAFPVDHPALAAAASGFVWTSQPGRARLRGRLPQGLRVELPVEPSGPGDESLAMSVAGAIERARLLLEARTILIEAGPTIASTLYPDRREAARLSRGGSVERVDELLLSRFEGELAAEAVGPRFVSDDRIRAWLGAPRSARRFEEESGAWCFERYRVGA